MTDLDFNRKLKALQDLISTEKQAALRDLHKQDFVSRLNVHLKSRSRPSQARLRFIQRPQVWVLSGIMAVTLAVVFKTVWAPSPYNRSIKALENILTSASQRPVSIPAFPDQRSDISPAESAYYQFEWSMKRILYKVQRENVRDEDIPFLFHNILLGFEKILKSGSTVYSDQRSLFPELGSEIQKLREEKNFQVLFALTLKKLREV